MPVRDRSTTRQLRLGSELRKLREAAGVSSTEAGRLLGTSQAQISNIEAGRVGVSPDRVRAMANNYCCTDQALINALAVMAGERHRGWWEEYHDTLPASLLSLAEAEHHARALRVSQVINIPGLLQTPEHARALFREAVPPLLPHEIEYRVGFRIKRQAILYRETPPSYTAIIHEAALRMRFGGTAVARAQLDHLLSLSEREGITILVIPFGGQLFPTSGQGIDYFCGPVAHLDTVHIDTVHGGALVENVPQLQKNRLVLDRMESAALSPSDSRDIIRRISRDD
ncbi:helix-turn-helix domain-containing protein [Streptomyces rectiverticillatus]|uniref:helix-turn-helix domain-containing protein n=1 Tax=Streptomyces rectiverticillatus TaxID=173860 RepID=UPI003CCE4F5C